MRRKVVLPVFRTLVKIERQFKTADGLLQPGKTDDDDADAIINQVLSWRGDLEVLAADMKSFLKARA